MTVVVVKIKHLLSNLKVYEMTSREQNKRSNENGKSVENIRLLVKKWLLLPVSNSRYSLSLSKDAKISAKIFPNILKK